MTDDELTILAAKAVGIEISAMWGKPMVPMQSNAALSRDWTPLILDGDAFRLMVDLQMMVDQIVRGFKAGHVVAVRRPPPDKNGKIGPVGIVCFEPGFGARATRRAIVRAAAGQTDLES